MQIFPSAIAAPVWVSPSNGLTIAIDADVTPPDKKLHVFFRNTSEREIVFDVGTAVGFVGPMYRVDITSIAPDSSTCKLGNTTVVGVAGQLTPIVIRLAPGATEQISIELKRLICMTKDSVVPLDELLGHGHLVRAAFTGTAEVNALAKVQSGWTGTVTSGLFALKPSVK